MLSVAAVNTLVAVRLRCGLVALAIATAACGSSSAASSSPSSTGATSASGPVCGPQAARTVAQDTVARVYVAQGAISGCARDSSRRYLLGRATTCIRSARAGPFALAATVVAYAVERCGVDTGSAVVVVRRLSTGAQLRSLPATTGPLSPESYQHVGSLAVRVDGSVAWIGVASSIIRHSQTIEVHRADRRGTAELDSGLAIGPGSLRLHGTTLSWRHADLLRAATLL